MNPINLCMKMNPLDISEVSKNKTFRNNNARGRPPRTEMLKFSPQPKSFLISQVKEHLKKNVAPNNFKEVSTDQEKAANLKSNILCSNKALSKERKYTCDYGDCTYTCKLSCNLIKHKRTHTAEKPYLCDQCSFRSNFVNSLKVHKRIHTSERPYVCKHCTYKCNSSSNLKKHFLHRHPEVLKI